MDMAEALGYWEYSLKAHGYGDNPLDGGFTVEARVRPEDMSHSGELWWHATLPNGETKWLCQVVRIVGEIPPLTIREGGE